MKLISGDIIDNFHSCAQDSFEGYELQSTDKEILDKLAVPVPAEESKRLEVVRQTDLLDSDKSDSGFDRISSLVTRLFEVPFAAITLVDIDRIWYKSSCGVLEIEVTEIPRDYGFDSFTILSDAPEVQVFYDLSSDVRFVNNPFVSGEAKVKFYAGTPIIVEGVKIGTLCVLDTKPREAVSLQEKENLLDLGAAVSLIASQRRDAFLRLHNERTNIVVSMMHNLRTPLTSLNFAASLLSNEKAKLSSNKSPSKRESEDKKLTNPISSNFPPTFTEINQALNQLNLLVDSTLCLGHTIIKCNSVAVGSNTMRNSSYVDCDLIAYLRDLYNKFNEDSLSCKINWVVDTKFLGEGSHVSYPDAILLVLVSSIGYVSLEWKKITINFSFISGNGNAVQFPELADRILEGHFLIQLYPSDCVSTGEGESSGLVSNTLEYKYSSIEKILKSIGGGCRQTWGNSTSGDVPLESGISGSLRMNLKRLSVAPQILHEFWVPCKIILNESSQLLMNSSSRNGNLRDKTITYGGTGSPINITPKNLDSSKAAKRSSILRASRGQLKVLVIEDTISVQKLLSRWLHKNGCLATCANNGKIGLDLLKTSVFDIVLIDYLMPVMLGLTTMRLFQEWLNAGDDKDDHPIKVQNGEALLVGMSATALESEQEEGFQYGMHFFMPKPADLQILGMIIDAKKASLCNADAIEAICTATGTSAEPIGSSDPTHDRSNLHSFSTVTATAVTSDGGFSTKTCDDNFNDVVSLAVRNKGGNSGGSTNQWKLFRSFLQPRKVYPEVKN